MQSDGRLGRVTPIRILDRARNGDHTVHRSLEGAGEFRGDHLDGAPVMPEDRIGSSLARHGNDVPKFDYIPCAGQSIGRHGNGEHALIDDPLTLRQGKADRNRPSPPAAVRIARDRAGTQAADGIVHIRLFDAMVLEIVLVYGDPDALRSIAEAVVNIDDEGHALECLADLGRDSAARLGIGAVDLSQKSREHRRPGRWLDYFEGGPFGKRQSLQSHADVESDIVARTRAMRPLPPG